MGTCPVALARSLGEVGSVHSLGEREDLWVGTRFAILGFSHGLSLNLTRRAGSLVLLVWPARLP